MINVQSVEHIPEHTHTQSNLIYLHFIVYKKFVVLLEFSFAVKMKQLGFICVFLQGEQLGSLSKKLFLFLIGFSEASACLDKGQGSERVHPAEPSLLLGFCPGFNFTFSPLGLSLCFRSKAKESNSNL